MTWLPYTVYKFTSGLIIITSRRDVAGMMVSGNHPHMAAFHKFQVGE